MTGAEKKLIDQYRQQGMGSTEIAGRLNLSVNTVKSYCRRNKVAGDAVSSHVCAPSSPSSGTCRQCGKPMIAAAGKREKHFCSDRCRYQWWHLHRGQSVNATEHVCPACGKMFKTNRQQKYCRHACYIAARFGGQNQNETDKRTV